MRDEKRVVTLNNYEQRLLVRGLSDFRNGAIRAGKPTEDLDGLLLKVIDAPTKREKRRNGVVHFKCSRKFPKNLLN